jgi:hypothetical protein
MRLLPNQVPLVIGVTGHRDLRPQDVPLLEKEVRAIITRLRHDYFGGSTDATPFVLVSALAEGADRVVARVALSMGLKLIAPLPLPVEEYRKDFEPGLNANAGAEFDKFLSQAVAAPVMPFTSGNSIEAVRSDPNKRAEQYRAIGLFIVQNCDVLIALWDGSEKDMAVGGTGEVVTFKREGIPLAVSRSALASLDGSEIGPVIHILTPRMKAGSPASAVAIGPWGIEIVNRHRGGRFQRRFDGAKAFCAKLLRRGEKATSLSPQEKHNLDAWEVFATLAALTHEFNNEAVALEGSSGVPFDETGGIDNLFIDPDTGHLNEEARLRATNVAPHWCRLFGIADTLAKRRQAQFKFDWLRVFLLTVFAIFCFALAGHGGENVSNFSLAAYTVVVGIIYVLIIWARNRRDQERFLDYRALAEALRVAVYWSLLGIDEDESSGKKNLSGTTSTLINCYPIKQPNELAWIKICLRSLDLFYRPAATANTGPEMDSDAHRITRRFWVYGQLVYFQRQSALYNRHAEFLEGWAKLIFFTTPFFLVPFILSALGENQYLGIKPHEVFVAALGILPGVAAILSSYSERLGLTAQARQYDRMRMLFKRAYDLLPETLDAAAEHQARSLYLELGTEAMKESADWVAIYRQRPIAPVQ